MLTFDDLCRNRKEEQEGFRVQNVVFYLFLAVPPPDQPHAESSQVVDCEHSSKVVLVTYAPCKPWTLT